MVFLEKFCVWFSVRLGSIVVGVFTLVQSSVWLMVSIITAGNEEDASKTLTDWTTTMSFENQVTENISKDPRTYLICLGTFFAVLLVCSLLLIVGSYQCTKNYIYPFLVVDAVYMVFLLAAHICIMLYLKEKELAIGYLILYSNLGALVLMFLLYLWCCVLSFLQIMKELEKEKLELGLYRQHHVRQVMDFRYQYNVPYATSLGTIQ